MKSCPPPGFPYKWCSSSGEDEFGIWLEFNVADSVQRMRWIHPGRFLMGSPAEELHRYHYETQHEVTLSKGFWLADTACSQELWQVVMEKNPSRQNNLQNPVDNISWDDCNEFLHKINSRIKDIALSFPTEAQWEYACRAGTKTPYSFGITITPDQVNYNGAHPYIGEEKALNRGRTVALKSLPPNQWGLYEMHGNVWEWCSDWFEAFESGSVTDPAGPASGTYRVVRGGSAFSGAADCRSAARSRFHSKDRYNRFGFRFLWIPPETETKKERQAEEHHEWSDGNKEEDLAISPKKAEMIMKNTANPGSMRTKTKGNRAPRKKRKSK